MISVPQMACKGLGIAPLGPPDVDPKPSVRIIQASEDCRCSFCGRAVPTGEVGLQNPLKTVGLFMDDFALARPGEKWACCWCAPLLKAAPMRALMNSVVCAEGVFPISKVENRKYFLLNPPEPPWAILVSAAKLEHLVWRAIPTIDNRFVQVLHGGDCLTVRLRNLSEYAADCKQLTDMLIAKVSEGKGRPPKYISPFRTLGNKRDSLQHGILRPLAYQLPEAKFLVSKLESLSQGELWALATILGDIAPIKPEKIKIQSKGE